MVTRVSVAFLVTIAMLLVTISPVLAVEDPDPSQGPEPVGNPSTERLKEDANRTANKVKGMLPIDLPGEGGNPNGPGSGNSSSSAPPKDPDAAPPAAQKAIIRVYDVVDEAEEASEDAPKQASNILTGALGALLSVLDDFFRGSPGGSGDDTVGTRLHNMVVAPAAAHPALLLGVVATTSALLSLLYVLRRVAPFAFVPLLSRISKSELYHNDARRLVAQLVEQDPGMCLHEIVERTGHSRNAVSYHLFVLEKEELIISVKDGKYRRYFLRGGKYVNGAKSVVSVLKNATSLRIAQFVRDHPGVIQRDVCQVVGTSPSAACWHTKRLERAGVLRKERQGNTVQYYLGPALEKYDLADFGLVDPVAC